MSNIDRSNENTDKRTARHGSSGVGGLPQPIQPKATWDELELAATDKQLLREITDQIKSHNAVHDDRELHKLTNRGPGTIVLFAGDNGTGKTMAAEVVARELSLLLYRIDLSAVVSKYIGETEKNLSTIFDAAESTAAILYFDEADALFGKRTEVKDSHDRYAIIEIGYFLQRMESYRGLSIVATHTKDSIDPAFLRHFHYVMEFGAQREK
ncbi:MAG: ATP-binding protein [Acidobacteriia bacterium]|nr:ATP-binding protein [Terriglobia bacterium]